MLCLCEYLQLLVINIDLASPRFCFKTCIISSDIFLQCVCDCVVLCECALFVYKRTDCTTVAWPLVLLNLCQKQELGSWENES